MGKSLVGILVLLSLTHSEFALASKWKWLQVCGKAIVTSAGWIRRNPDSPVDENTLALADQEVPPTGSKILDWLARIRSYLNPNIAALITRGAQIFPEFTNTQAPQLTGPRIEQRVEIWTTLLDLSTPLNEFEALLPTAQEILLPEERVALAKWHFTRGILSAARNPNDSDNDQLKRAVLLTRSDQQMRQTFVDGVQQQLPRRLTGRDPED